MFPGEVQTMPTYIYESIPHDDREPERFEVTQRMNDAPLTVHPESGLPLRRIVTGGNGILGKPLRRSTQVDKSLAAATPCGCSRGALAAMSARGQTPRSPASCGHGHGAGRHRH
jgi:predicted nucleic acid-binding Zn ribbon protein